MTDLMTEVEMVAVAVRNGRDPLRDRSYLDGDVMLGNDRWVRVGGRWENRYGFAGVVPDTQSLVDPLTGLLKLAGFPALLELRLGVAVRIIYFNVRGMMHFNDDHGPAAGDDLLRTIGTIMREETASDEVETWLFRVGGDHFVIIRRDLHDGLRERLTTRIPVRIAVGESVGALDRALLEEASTAERQDVRRQYETDEATGRSRELPPYVLDQAEP